MRENWTPVHNAWENLPDYDCFCCGPSHSWGFRLRFFHDPDEDLVVSEAPPIKEEMAGWPGVLHGGFTAMLLDEVMVWGVMHYARKSSFTGKMEVRFTRGVPTGRPLMLQARPVKITRRLARMEGWMRDEDGLELASGSGTYIIPSPGEFRDNFAAGSVPEAFEPYLRS